jgi:hypothetical protein
MTPFAVICDSVRGMQYHSWLRNYGTSQKVMGSIPYEVNGFFNWPNPFGHTMGIGSTQPLSEMSTRNLPGGKEWLACKADILTAICVLTIDIMWEPLHNTTVWAFTACYRDSFTFFMCQCVVWLLLLLSSCSFLPHHVSVMNSFLCLINR